MPNRKLNMTPQQYDKHRKRLWNKIEDEEALNKEVTTLIKFNGIQHLILKNMMMWYRKHHGSISKEIFIKKLLFEHEIFKECKNQLK